MTYKYRTHCFIGCQLKRVLRHLGWARASRPIGTLTNCSYSAVRVHFSSKGY